MTTSARTRPVSPALCELLERAGGWLTDAFTESGSESIELLVRHFGAYEEWYADLAVALAAREQIRRREDWERTYARRAQHHRV